jgi:hypothetical protein
MYRTQLRRRSGRLDERGRRGVVPERDGGRFDPAKATTNGDELVVDACDLDCCRENTGTLFDFDRYRRD